MAAAKVVTLGSLWTAFLTALVAVLTSMGLSRAASAVRRSAVRMSQRAPKALEARTDVPAGGDADRPDGGGGRAGEWSGPASGSVGRPRRAGDALDHLEPLYAGGAGYAADASDAEGREGRGRSGRRTDHTERAARGKRAGCPQQVRRTEREERRRARHAERGAERRARHAERTARREERAARRAERAERRARTTAPVQSTRWSPGSRVRSLPPTIKQRIRAEAHNASPSVRKLPALDPVCLDSGAVSIGARATGRSTASADRAQLSLAA